MHNAPSVSYPAGRSHFAAALLLGIWLLGCVAAAFWHLHTPEAWRLAAMLGALCASGSFGLALVARTQWHTGLGWRQLDLVRATAS